MKDWPHTVLSKNSNKPRSANWATRRQGFDANLRFHKSQGYDNMVVLQTATLSRLLGLPRLDAQAWGRH